MTGVQNDAKTIKVVVNDETRLWPQDIVEQTGKLLGVYVYDAAATFADSPETTPRHQLWFLYTQPEKEVSEELLETIFQVDAHTEIAHYVPQWRVQELRHIASHEPDPSLSSHDNVQRAIDYFQRNCPL
jgi:hypothetical protein